MKRLFIGFLLPDRVSRRLDEEVAKLRATGADVRWTPAPLMHVTLRFLGDCPDGSTLDASRLLAESARGTRALKLVAKGLGTFPDEGPPRIVHVGMVGEDPAQEEAFRELRRKLNDGARAYGYRPEKGAFRPHATLGRVREGAETELMMRKLGPGVRREFAHFRVEQIALFESTEVFDERAYVPLAVAKLA